MFVTVVRSSFLLTKRRRSRTDPRRFPRRGFLGSVLTRVRIWRQSDGESAYKRDSVTPRGAGDHPSMRSTRGLLVSPPKRRATSTLCSTLLRKGFAEPTGSPPLLVRSYRTVSPLPVAGCPTHRRSAFCCTVPSGSPDLALASFLLYGVPTFLDRVMPCRGHPANSPSLHSL
jgi:hypothetical protein